MVGRPSTDADIDHSADGIQPPAYTSRFIESGGVRLHYLDYGTAGRPPMLCVHGGAAHAHWFDFVAPGFGADYHVRALDQRGHGESAWAVPPAYSYADYASDLAAVANKLDLHDFILVGHSMGGTVALMYAANYPGRVGRLVVVDSTLQLTGDRVATLRDVGSRQGSSYATREEFIARYRVRPVGNTTAPAIIRYLARFSARKASDNTWQNRFDRNVYARRETVDGLPCWNQIRIPALLVKGEYSQRITPHIIAEVKARCPHVELAEVTRSDHHVTLDNPAGFTHAVNAFLAQH